MQLRIPDIKLKGISKKFNQLNCPASLTDFYRVLSYIKNISESQESKSGWVYAYSSKLEDLTVHFLELLIIMCNWGIIEIMDEGYAYKLRVRITQNYRDTTREIEV